MFFTYLILIAFHSSSNWQLPSRQNYQQQYESAENSNYEINQPGFHKINDIHGGDSINVKFNQQSLRLFLFITGNSLVFLNNLFIDGKDTLSYISNSKDKVAFAVDANQEAIFKFESLPRHDYHHYFNRSHQEFHHNRIFNHKAIKNKVKSVMSVFNFHNKGTKNSNDFDDFENFGNSIDAVLWLLPREMCGKSSVFEYGGLDANLSVEPTTSIITSKTSEEITYSNCIFSPLFDIISAKVSYDVTLGIKPADSYNSYPTNYKTSTTEIYTDNINSPDWALLGHQDDNNRTLSKPFFVKYEIKQKVQNMQSNSPLHVKTIMNRKINQDMYDSFILDFFCLSGVVESCNPSTCFHDYDIDSKLILKCNDNILDTILGILIGVAVLILVVIIVVICICCIGCCACCGWLCCPYCCKKEKSKYESHHHHHSSSNLNVPLNPNAVDAIPATRPINSKDSNNDMEIPLMSLDPSQNSQQIYQPTPMYQTQPAVYYLQSNQINATNPPNVVYVPQNVYQIPIQHPPVQPQHQP